MATSPDFSALETNTVATFQGDSWLGSEDPLRVRTFQPGFKADTNADLRKTLGFGPDDLPGLISISQTRFGTKLGIGKSTIGEFDVALPMVAFIIDRKTTEAAGIASVVPVQEQMLRVVLNQVQAGKKWTNSGTTMIESVSTDLSIIKDGLLFIVSAEVTWNIRIFLSLE